MDDLIRRQAAIDVLAIGEALLRCLLDDMDVVGCEREKYEWGLGLIESYILDMKGLQSAKPEVTEDVKKYCRKQPEPIRINLNEPIKVKLTDWGKEIYYHQYDRTNQIAGREICKPKFPKEDENGYTKFQLWCFIELYGEHMGLTFPNVIEPLEIVYERQEGAHGMPRPEPYKGGEA